MVRSCSCVVGPKGMSSRYISLVTCQQRKKRLTIIRSVSALRHFFRSEKSWVQYSEVSSYRSTASVPLIDCLLFGLYMDSIFRGSVHKRGMAKGYSSEKTM